MSLEADKSATEAEVKFNFTLLAKVNAFRLKICESEEKEKKFCDQVRVLKKKLKFMEMAFIFVYLRSITLIQYLYCLRSIMTFFELRWLV